MRKKKGAEAGAAPRATAEWASLIITVLLLCGLVSVIVSLWLGSSDKPARFRIERGAARNEAGHYYLPVSVTNEGDETVVEVRVEGRLKADGREENASTTFDFIPGHSISEGVLVFMSEPGAADVRVVSYQQP